MTVPLADTSLFIALEQGRPLRATPPQRALVSTITVGELRLGVLAAPNAAVAATRLRTLEKALEAEPVPVDGVVAEAWAALRAGLREQERRMPINDSWIAATAIAHGIPVATQDDDYDDVPGLEVVKL
ncbi:MAG: type II toxin-antitoxin system VapC family toxin [Actinomycetota bacterium]|nr:type II toxin-antitoxin system VapC family toxin [Actinomycetota bacterium]